MSAAAELCAEMIRDLAAIGSHGQMLQVWKTLAALVRTQAIDASVTRAAREYVLMHWQVPATTLPKLLSK